MLPCWKSTFHENGCETMGVVVSTLPETTEPAWRSTPEGACKLPFTRARFCSSTRLWLQKSPLCASTPSLLPPPPTLVTVAKTPTLVWIELLSLTSRLEVAAMAT